jgi:transketolase
MRDAFAGALNEACKEHDNIFFLVADISPASSLQGFLDDNPTRFIDVGVSEQSLVGMAAGLAMSGFRPFAYTIANFTIYRPFEQVRVDLCYQNLPVVLVGVGAGISYSALGGTHHTIEDIAIMSALPNMTVVAPCDPLEVASAVFQSFRLEGPMYLRIGKAGEPNLTTDAVEDFQLGKIRKLKEGKGTAVVGYGPLLGMVFDLIAEHPKQLKDLAVFSAHTLKPFDDPGMEEILTNYANVIVVEEHVYQGGLGSHVVRLARRTGPSTKFQLIHLKDEFIHVYGTREDVLAAHGIDKQRILDEILS